MSGVDFREIINRAKDQVFPAVVFIKCLRESFESGDRKPQEVSGSGALISPDGEVMTNWHVVEKAIEVRCLLQDGRAFPAQVLGSDKDTDVALLRLELPADTPALPHARLGDSSQLTEGDFVMAMGAPWGLARSVSIGIISCSRRFLPDVSEYSCWLQTDAAISPGNSGGPLVNTDGEIIGVNTRGALEGGDLGFAVPSNVAREVTDRIRDDGAMAWSWCGLQLQPLHDFERNVYFDAEEGVMVAGTDPDSPARQAGFRPGDRILAFNDRSVTAMTDEDLPDIRRQLGLMPADEPARATLRRGERQLTVTFTPRHKGAVEGEAVECPRWDFTVKAINRFDTPTLYLQRREGVYVFGVRYPGNAQAAGLRRNDIILRINGQEVRTPAEVKQLCEDAVAHVEENHRAVLHLQRNGLQRQLVLDFSRDYHQE